MNEVFAVHYKGELLNAVSGMRRGAVYTTVGYAKSFITRTTKRWNKLQKWYPDQDATQLEVVRYVPEVKS